MLLREALENSGLIAKNSLSIKVTSTSFLKTSSQEHINSGKASSFQPKIGG